MLFLAAEDNDIQLIYFYDKIGLISYQEIPRFNEYLRQLIYSENKFMSKSLLQYFFDRDENLRKEFMND